MRRSNNWVGFINLLTFLASIPILGGGIWLSNRANSTDCMRFLQWPLIIIGISIMVVSLVGFGGACYKNTFLMYVYLWAMFIIIVSLIGFIIFAYAVTDKGQGRSVLNRGYMEYYLQDYSGGWLEERVVNDGYWVKIATCVRDSNACGKLTWSFNGYPESADMFNRRNLNPIQSGCCKPPTGCGYVYNNETIWTSGGNNMVGSDVDCLRWNNDQRTLCYNCNSCKAGVIASIKHSWRKVSVINIVILIILIVLYVVSCAAFRHNKRIDNDEPYGETRMEKSQPSMIHF